VESFFPPEEIKTERAILCRHDPSMAVEYMHKINQDRDRLQIFLPWVSTITVPEHETVYLHKSAKDWENRTLFNYAIVERLHHDLIGSIGVFNISWAQDSLELGYLVFTPYEGKGYVSEALRALEDVFFTAGINRIEIRCSAKNQRSIDLCFRNHYHLDGILRQNIIENNGRRDTMVFAKLRQEYGNSQ
jgi:ribosomal-protein-serine acetyltransferase